MAESNLNSSRRFSGALMTFFVWALMASQTHAEPIRLSNGQAATWELVEQDGDRHCLLRTKLVGSPSLDTLDVSRSIGGRDFELTIRGPGTGKSWAQFNSTYAIDGGPEAVRQLTDDEDDGGRRALSIGFANDEAAALYGGAPLLLSIDPERSVTIDTKGLAALQRAVDQCSRDRLVSLGAEPDLVSRIAVEPYAEDTALFNSMDYPEEAIRKEQEGTTMVLLRVSKRGRVKSCRVAESSKFEVLDHATCETLKRGVFEPAKDFSGRSIESPMALKVRWVLPESPAVPVEFSSSRYIFSIDKNQQIADCRVEGSGAAADPSGPCLIMLGEMRQLVSAAPKDVQLAGQEMVVATEYLVGPTNEPIALGLGKGEALLSRSVTHLSIDPSGKAGSCTAEIIGSAQGAGEKAFCDEALGQVYEALPVEAINRAERQLTIVRALYLRQRRAGM